MHQPCTNDAPSMHQRYTNDAPEIHQRRCNTQTRRYTRSLYGACIARRDSRSEHAFCQTVWTCNRLRCDSLVATNHATARYGTNRCWDRRGRAYRGELNSLTTVLVRQFPGPVRVTEASAQSACPTAYPAVLPIGSRTSRSSEARKAWLAG